MKTTAVLWFSLFCFGINLQQGFGQCTNPTVFWRDADGDGFGDRNFLTDDIVDAQLDYESSDDTFFAISNNIAYGCSNNAPAGWVTPFSKALDFDDNNPLITDRLPRSFFRDFDGDGFGDPSVSVYQSYAPAGYVTDNTDCDDGDASINPNNVWHQDADGDGVGGSISQQACVQPPGYVSSTGDACDNNSATLVVLTWYKDADGDGFGGSNSLQACIQPLGYVPTGGDECDNNPSTQKKLVWFLDGDKDGYGGNTSITACTDPSDSTNSYVSSSLDRDDTNPCITDKTPVTYYEDAYLCVESRLEDTLKWIFISTASIIGVFIIKRGKKSSREFD